MAKTVTFPYAVIYNGILYPADTEIEVKTATVSKMEQVDEETVDEEISETEKPKKRGAKA